MALMAKVAVGEAGFRVEEQFPFLRLPLGVLAPSAPQSAAFEKHDRADPGAIMG